VTGGDRRTYLQGLLTNDIEALTAGSGCYAAMLTAQGRMISDMYVDELGDSILLRVPIALADQIREHLDRFVFSEDVQVADVTSATGQLGVYGPRAEEVAGGLSGSTRLALDDLPGIALVVETAAVETAIRELTAAGGVEATLGDFDVARIEAAVPRFDVDMGTDTIPLEAGIEDRAVSRTKGCYVGQEVIVRVLDRGHGRVAKRLVQLVFAPGAAVPEAGSTVTSGDREIGRVTSATFSPSQERPVALAYVHRDSAAVGTVLSVNGSDATVRVV